MCLEGFGFPGVRAGGGYYASRTRVEASGGQGWFPRILPPLMQQFASPTHTKYLFICLLGAVFGAMPNDRHSRWALS